MEWPCARESARPIWHVFLVASEMQCNKEVVMDYETYHTLKAKVQYGLKKMLHGSPRRARRHPGRPSALWQACSLGGKVGYRPFRQHQTRGGGDGESDSSPQ